MSRRCLVLLLLILPFVSGPTVSGQTVITGFGTGAGFAFNTNGTLPLLSGGVLTITDNFGQSRSAMFMSQLGISNFTAQFTYQATGSFLADGVTFVIHNDSRGPNALGDGGSGLGYANLGATAAISPSVALQINIYSAHTIGIGLGVNGSWGSYQNTGSVAVNGGNPIRFNLAYSGTTLAVTLTDLITSLSYTTNFTVNIPGIIGGGMGYVGFTGATGGLTAVQTISAFTMTAVPEPGTVALLCVGVLGLAAFEWKRRALHAKP